MTASGASSEPAVTPYAARLSRRRIVVTTAAVMAGMFLAALDGTIVATALPTIIGDLRGIDRYAWVFSGYLLAEIATIPLWGRFADMYGRKRVFLSGMAIFLVGSALSGLAQSMTQLVAFRAVQGIGAGCLLPVAQTISGDLFTLEQRVKVQAVYTAVFGLASIVGPFLGGFLTDNLSWRWVFYVNLPIGLATALLVKLALIEPLEHRRDHEIDWLGIITLVGSTGFLLYALESGGRDYAWSSAVILGSFAISAAFVVAFLAVEVRAVEPLLPLDLFAVPVLRASAITTTLLGMTMFAVLSYLPLFAQVVIGTSATGAGRVLTPLMLGFMFSSFVGGRLLLRAGFRVISVSGALLTNVGLVLLTRLTVHSTQLEVSRDMVVVGFGFGLVLLACVLAAQNSVGSSQMGVATSLVNFTRQFGGAIGVAIAAAVMLDGLTSRLEAAFPGVRIHVADMLSPASKARAIPPAARRAVREAFSGALHQTFLATLVLGLVTLAVSLLMPRGRATEVRDTARAAEPEVEAAAS